MAYKLELFGTGKKAVATLEKRSKELIEDLQGTFRLCDSQAAAWKELMLHDLTHGRSWNILTNIGGIRHNPENKHTMLDNARKYFTGKEIQQALTIAINAALLLSDKKGAPGYQIGHTVLFEELMNEDSPFYGLIDEKMIKRLNNGRFWESLPSMGFNILTSAYKTMDNVLMNYPNDLDVAFAPKGMDILYRESVIEPNITLCDILCGGFPPEDVRGLALPAIDRYVQFIRIIDSQLGKLGISKKRFTPLVKAYCELLDDPNDWTDLYFEDIELRRKDPLVKRYSKK